MISFVPPSKYIFPLYDLVAAMKGIDILMHIASITYISGCESTEKYSVLPLFRLKAAMYNFLFKSENVGLQPYIFSIASRTASTSMSP